MPTPPKPYLVLASEKKSHRTKAELEKRKAKESDLASGVALRVRQEVKDNPVAYEEFRRVRNLLKAIGKNDAIYEAVINRYCLIQSECMEFEGKRERFHQNLIRLEEEYDNNPDQMSMSEYFKLQCSMQGQIVSIDKQIQTKRKMLLDIEKENVMTIAAALRTIPKTEGEESDDDPMATLLRNRG